MLCVSSSDFSDPSYSRAMVIDCDELFKGGSDSSLLSSLAKQTGYWPLFTFVNQISGLLDMAAVGLIGQKSEKIPPLLD